MAAPLAERHCAVCGPATQPMSRSEADAGLAQLSGWAVAEDPGRLSIEKTFRFKGFLPGVDLVNLIAPIADAEGHHPELCLEYGKLIVMLWTHVADGLTDNDFILAARIDAAIAGRS
jgi:4a-hydroxytetrahydrobiopterin dehydratase